MPRTRDRPEESRRRGPIYCLIYPKLLYYPNTRRQHRAWTPRETTRVSGAAPARSVRIGPWPWRSRRRVSPGSSRPAGRRATAVRQGWRTGKGTGGRLHLRRCNHAEPLPSHPSGPIPADVRSLRSEAASRVVPGRQPQRRRGRIAPPGLARCRRHAGGERHRLRRGRDDPADERCLAARDQSGPDRRSLRPEVQGDAGRGCQRGRIWRLDLRGRLGRVRPSGPWP